MKNPYEILGLSQNATKEEIQSAFIKAQIENLKTRKYEAKELMEARCQLMTPAKRLVADFLFPSKLKSKRPKFMDISGLEIKEMDNYSTLSDDEFDSLKYSQSYV